MKTAQQTSSEQGAHIDTCPVCNSNLAYPYQRRQLTCGRWQLLMLCPECFAWWEATICLDRMHELKQSFGRSQVAIARELASLEKQNMKEECEKFIAALHADNIQPIDF